MQCVSVEVDDITDILNNANLMCCMSCDLENTFNEELIFCKPLNTRATTEEIIHLIHTYISRNDIAWKKGMVLSSDGAYAMEGVRTGLFSKIKVIAPEYARVHSSIHTEALAIKMCNGFWKLLCKSVKKI